MQPADRHARANSQHEHSEMQENWTVTVVPDWVASTGQGQSVEVILYNDSSSTVCCRTPLAPTRRGARELQIHSVMCYPSHGVCARKLAQPSDTHVSMAKSVG
jgi:hypothetical protein